MSKFLIPFVLLASMVSCAHTSLNKGRVDAVEARESVYKVKVVLTLDTSPLQPKKEEGEEASTDASKVLFTPKSNGLRPIIISKIGNTAKIGWSGTGWVASRENGKSFVVSAGHVCESRDFFTVEVFDLAAWTINEVKLPIIEKRHTLLSRENIEVGPVTILADEDLGDDFSGPDMCLIGASGDLGTPLPIGDSDPEYASHAEVIGAPTGLWGGNIAIIADLKYSGRGNVWGGGVEESLAFTGDVAGGNSGSAIMQDGKVVAMLNFGGTRFKELTTGVPWEKLRDFLRRNLHRSPKKD